MKESGQIDIEKELITDVSWNKIFTKIEKLNSEQEQEEIEIKVIKNWNDYIKGFSDAEKKIYN